PARCRGPCRGQLLLADQTIREPLRLLDHLPAPWVVQQRPGPPDTSASVEPYLPRADLPRYVGQHHFGIARTEPVGFFHGVLSQELLASTRLLPSAWRFRPCLF